MAALLDIEYLLKSGNKMAILRCLNEFTRESVCMALEPARECVANCTYCFARINQMKQYANRKKSNKDNSSFERTLEKAYSPSYDPTNFSQWALHNRLVLGWANTVEPFQDEQQAISLLTTLDKFSIPIFVQTKGVNFLQMVSYLEPFKDNSSIFVSLPSLDQRVAKRFEPGTPPVAERLKIIEMLRDLDFWVIAALSPYHEEWNEDPVKLINTLADSGVNEIFFDRLHLTQNQHKTVIELNKDTLMASMAGGRGKVWPLRAFEHFRAIHQATMENDLEFFSNGFEGTCYGFYNTLPTISPDSCFSRGNPWPYHDGMVFRILEDTFYDEDQEITPVNRDPDFSESILIRWSDVLAIMESKGSIDQPFSYSSLMDIVPIYKRIPDTLKDKILGGKHTKGVSPMKDWFACLWQSPYKHQFCWRHPWLKIACNMDGVPLLDSDGFLQGIFDPDYLGSHHSMFRKVESLDSFRTLEFSYIDIGEQNEG